mgnify:CR=1 FL=1
MSGFSTSWLEAREPVDLRARNPEMIAIFAARLAERRQALARPLLVLDLGAGTGATLRALAPHLPEDTCWRFAEHDPALVERSIEMADRHGHAVEAIESDLSQGLSGDLAEALLEDVDAVTTSAFLDLVSRGWIEGAASTLAARGLPFLAMLTFDGRQEADPAHPLDARIREAMAAHQEAEGVEAAHGGGASREPPVTEEERLALNQHAERRTREALRFISSTLEERRRDETILTHVQPLRQGVARKSKRASRFSVIPSGDAAMTAASARDHAGPRASRASLARSAPPTPSRRTWTG